MELEDFRKLLNKKKPYRNLPDIYKTDKFLLLYLKMYEYMLSIPKEEIVLVKVRNCLIGYGLLRYIKWFLRAKDFNNWRYRIYELMTKNIPRNSFEQYMLLYNSKAKEFWDEYIELQNTNRVEHFKNIYNVENPSQLEEVKEKRKQTTIKNWGVENYVETDDFRNKREQTWLKNYGVKNPFQSKEIQDKFKENYLAKHGCENPFQDEEVKEKIKKRNLETRGVEYASQDPEFRARVQKTVEEKFGVKYACLISQSRPHSKIGDDFCINLYTKLPDDMKPYVIFQKKDNKEYWLRDKDKFFYYDFTISSECVKVIVEFDGIYWHGLIEGQKYVLNKSVEEVWENDLEKQKLAESMGFRVIRVREDEYLEDKEGCLERVLSMISNT